MSSLISARNITKRFGNFIAVDSISFDVNRGSIVGFLGPNGAGKTTTIKMIYTAFPPEEGKLNVFGLSTRTHQREIKQRLGVVVQTDIMEEFGTCLDNLRLTANYYGVPWRMTRDRAMQFLKSMGLTDYANRNVRALSGGMKRRLSIAKGLISDPELLLLDEPTIGLDPQARLFLWDMIREIRDAGKTILMTTHYMEEAEKLCDHILIIDHGRIIAQGSPADLIKKHILIDLKDGSTENGRSPNLEDVFLKLTGREMRND